MERKKILIATKTYPSISAKYRETVCTAGILLTNDEVPVEWIRIYPIPFRYIDFDKRFPRWSIVSAEIERNDKDYRSESYRINHSSIDIIKKIDTENNWQIRKNLVLPLQFDSVQEIQNQGKSLGILKPQSLKYYCKKTTRDWTDKQKAVQDQLDLFEASSPLENSLEKIPYQFGYQFTDGDGKNRRYSISDWEISELYRRCRNNSKASSTEGKEQEALLKVREKLEGFIIDKDLYFIVGNLKGHNKVFMIIGLFYPPIVRSEQLDLF